MAGTTKIDEVFRAARRLSDRDRTELAHRLLDSVEAPDPHAGLDDEALAREIEKRADGVVSGRTKTTPWSRVKAAAMRKLRR